MAENGKKKVVITETAYQRIEQIYLHILENFDEKKASRVVESILNSIEKLSDFPKLGKQLARLPDSRSYVVAKNTVYYRIDGKTVFITTVRPRKVSDK